MKNTDFMNLSLPEGTDKIDIEILNSDFTAIENLLKQHAIIETMTLNGEGVIIGAIGPYIRLQNIDTVQVSIDIGNETFTLASGENMIIRETAENIGIITSGNTHITYFVNPKTYADKGFYTKEKVDELLSKVEGNVEVDAELSDTSENPVQNKVISAKFKKYYNSEEVDELIDGIGTPEDVYTKTETDNLLSTKSNKSNTYTKTETDNKITEKVSEIVAGAPEDFDTLKEMSDWLTEHEDSAATMNSAIQKNAEDIATANTAIQKNKTDIATANTNITKNAEDIATANTNIQKNVDDITITKNDVAINRTTLGTQRRNLLPYRCKPHSNSSGITVAVANDGVVTLSGTNTASFTYNIDFTTPMVFGRDVFIVGAEKLSNVSYSCKVDIAVNGSNYPVVGTAGLRIPAGTSIQYLYFQKQSTGNEIEATIAPMIVYADVTDLSYEPYTPSLQEQINTLLARIEALEGATTTEGGE